MIRAMLLVAAVGLAGPAHAAKSHLLQKAERHVVLTSVFSSGADDCTYFPNRILVEVGADGSAAAEPFAVPEKHVLVVTELDWTVVEAPTAFVAGRTLALSVDVGDSLVFRTGRITDADLAASGIWVGSQSTATGFRVAPGALLCPTGTSMATGVTTLHDVSTLVLRGYLVRSK